MRGEIIYFLNMLRILFKFRMNYFLNVCELLFLWLFRCLLNGYMLRG